MVLCGYTEFIDQDSEDYGQLSCQHNTLLPWCKDNLNLVWEGSTQDITEVDGIRRGDIVVQSSSGGEGTEVVDHVQMFAGYNDEGEAMWYSCGGYGDLATRGLYAENETSKYSVYVFRIPSIESDLT